VLIISTNSGVHEHGAWLVLRVSDFARDDTMSTRLSFLKRGGAELSAVTVINQAATGGFQR